MTRPRGFGMAIFASLIVSMGIANAGDWIADPKNGCKVWNPHPSPGESVNWPGACKNGLAEGKGILDWLKDGKAYERDEGEWRAGRQSGQGTQSWPQGRYSGQLVDGLPHGYGLLTVGDAQYNGEFFNGIPAGAGTLINASGTYSGNWQGGCFNDGQRRASFGVGLTSCP